MKHGLVVVLATSLMLCACTKSILTTEAWSPAPSADSDDEVVGSYWLPVAKFPVTIKRTKCVVTLAVGDAIFAPDGTHHYSAVFHHNSFTADDVLLETDNAGLLQSVNASSDPQYAAVIGKVFEIAADAAKLATVSARLDTLIAKPDRCNPDEDVDATLLVDLTSSNAANDIRAVLPDDMKVSVIPTRIVNLTGNEKRYGDDCKPGVAGICYRPAWPYEFEISIDDISVTSEGSGNKKKETEHAIKVKKIFATAIPDPEQIAQITLKRNGPTKSDIEMSFSHGVLTKYENNQPSTALAWVGIRPTF